MIKWLLRRRIDAFEKAYNYDLSYAREILDVSLSAALKLSRVRAFGSYCKDVPRDARVAASMVATMSEDCGPCTQLVVTMAERDGVAAETIKAILSGDEHAMTPQTALAFRFAHAVLRHDAVADSLRDEILKRWGQRALVSLAYAISGCRVYPTLKYALGHGRACTTVTLDGVITAVARRQAA